MFDGRGLRGVPRLSLRWKLTLWVGVVYLVIQGVLSLVLVLYQRQEVEEQFDVRLGRVATLAARAVAELGPPWRNGELSAVASEAGRGAVLGDVVLGVYAPDGRLLAGAALHAEDPATTAAVLADAEATPQFRTFPAAGNTAPVRVAYLAVTGRDGDRYVLQVGVTWAYAGRIVRRVSTALLYALPLGLIAATSAGYVLAGVATEPLRSAARVAQELEPMAPEPPHSPTPRHPELVELEHQLHDARRRITAAYQAQARFVSNVSHEMRTPIAVLLTEAQTMRDREDLPEDARTFVGSVEDEMQRLGRMVDAFLALTRLRGGSGGRHGEPTSLNDLVLDATQLSYQQARSASVSISLRLDEEPGEELCVDGDPELLRTMLDNVLRHAVRFAPAGSAVDVQVARRDGSAVVSVHDHGPGLSDELLPTLFDRFAATGQHDARPRSLGLEIAQGIAELHGGHIDARNDEAGGCRLTVALPRSADEDERTGKDE